MTAAEPEFDLKPKACLKRKRTRKRKKKMTMKDDEE